MYPHRRPVVPVTTLPERMPNLPPVCLMDQGRHWVFIPSLNNSQPIHPQAVTALKDISNVFT